MLPDDIFTRNVAAADRPIAGFYQWSRRDRVSLPIKLWFGPPTDEAGLTLDRSWRWQMLCAGEVVDITANEERGHSWAAIWPLGEDSRISKEEYDYLMARLVHARGRPNDPFANPDKRIDLRTAPLPF